LCNNNQGLFCQIISCKQSRNNGQASLQWLFIVSLQNRASNTVRVANTPRAGGSKVVSNLDMFGKPKLKQKQFGSLKPRKLLSLASVSVYDVARQKIA